MSYSSKTGFIVGFDPTAYHDDLANIDVVTIHLEQNDATVVKAQMPMARVAQNWGFGVSYVPRMGDLVEIGWDYEHFRGFIVQSFGEGDPIPDDLPVVTRRAFNLADQMASLNPDPDNDREMRATDLLERLYYEDEASND